MQRLVPAMIGVVLVAQSHAGLVDAQDTGVGDGDAVGVAGQVVDDAVGVVQAVYGIDHPVLRHQLVKQHVDLAGPGDPRELSRLGALTERTDQGAPEVARERAYREEVAALGWLSLTLGCEHTAGH